MGIFTVTLEDSRFDGSGMTEEEQAAEIAHMLAIGVYDVNDRFVRSVHVEAKVVGMAPPTPSDETLVA